MVLNTLIAIGTRIAGIFLLLYGIQTAGGSFVSYFSLKENNSFAWVPLIPAALIVLAGLLLVAWPRSIAGTLLPSHTPRDDPSPMTYDEFIAGACVLVGLYFLVSGILETVFLIAKFQATLTLGFPFHWSPDNIASVFYIAVELVAAVGLLFGAKAIGKLIRRVRSV